MFRFGGVLAVLILVLAGCAAPSETRETQENPTSAGVSSSTPPPPPAATPTVTVDTGSLHGTVLDDEQLPIEGVEVLVQELDLVSRTDVEGAFTFNDLVGGTYTLFASKVGYEQAGSKVDVLPGQVVWRNLTVKASTFTVAYYEAVPKTALIDLGQFSADILILKGLNQTCKTCKFPWYLENVMGFMAEYVYTRSTASCPGLESTNNIGYHLYRNFTGDDPYVNGVANSGLVSSGQLPDHGQVMLDEDTIYRPTDQLTWYVTSSQCPNYQQRLDIWFSFAYNGEFPDGYTAAPPK